jgi:hypothetical protein
LAVGFLMHHKTCHYKNRLLLSVVLGNIVGSVPKARTHAHKHCTLHTTGCNQLQLVFGQSFVFPNIKRPQPVAATKLGNQDHWSSCNHPLVQSSCSLFVVDATGLRNPRVDSVIAVESSVRKIPHSHVVC